MIKRILLIAFSFTVICLLLLLGEWSAGKEYKPAVLLVFLTLGFLLHKFNIVPKKYILEGVVFGMFFMFFELLFTYLVNYKELLGLTPKKVIQQGMYLRQQTFSDEWGIIKLLNTEDFRNSAYQINSDGFRSKYELDKATIDSLKKTSKVIMFIGDSYTEGSCAIPIDSSFVDLIDSKDSTCALNFGIGGTDPLQYELIAQKYIPELLPDMVIVVLCIGNDFMYYDRKPAPFKSLHYQTNTTTVSANLPLEHPDYEPNRYFESWDAAKSFYIKNFTITGERTHFLEQIFVEPSNFCSFLYYVPQRVINSFYFWKNAAKYIHHPLKNKITYNHLAGIRELCNKYNVKFKLIGAPTIRDMDKNQDEMYKKYQKPLATLRLYYPTNFIRSDYVSEYNDHFNNTGHQKFTQYIYKIITGAGE